MRLVFLGRLADLAGRGESSAAVDASLDWTVLMRLIAETCGEEVASEIVSSRVRVAMNGRLVADKGAVVATNGDEIAFLPPVSGG